MSSPWLLICQLINHSRVMASVVSARSMSSHHYRTNSQLSRDSWDTDTNPSSADHGNNLLADGFDDRPPPSVPSRSRHLAANREWIAATTPLLGSTDNTRMVIAIDYGTTYTGKIVTVYSKKVPYV